MFALMSYPIIVIPNMGFNLARFFLCFTLLWSFPVEKCGKLHYVFQFFPGAGGKLF